MQSHSTDRIHPTLELTVHSPVKPQSKQTNIFKQTYTPFEPFAHSVCFIGCFVALYSSVGHCVNIQYIRCTGTVSLIWCRQTDLFNVATVGKRDSQYRTFLFRVTVSESRRIQYFFLFFNNIRSFEISVHTVTYAIVINYL